ncbi:MAG TPA: sigma-70 family RNA polymerase sigma factor [Bryobacteraceae bacterium]|nr:sigma-70 family RNA polymerase sigma factor [Bryobacteraceae bacterium]
MDELIEKHIGYAHAIAGTLLSRYPSNVTQADLESAAEFGLVQAARAFDPERGISFTTFAYYRIRGAIFDEIRQLCRASSFEAAANDYLGEQLTASRPAVDAEAGYQELQGITSHLVSSYLLSLDSLTGVHAPETEMSPISQVLHREEAETVRRALDQIPERYRTVLYAYYYQELSFESIGRRLHLSRSWVSRLHAKALSMLHGSLKNAGKSERAADKRARNLSKSKPHPSNTGLAGAITQWGRNESCNRQLKREVAANV